MPTYQTLPAGAARKSDSKLDVILDNTNLIIGFTSTAGGDRYLASYSVDGSGVVTGLVGPRGEAVSLGGAGTFADAEVPTGAINSSNTVFTLAHTPSPAVSLQLFRNGVLQRAGGIDYTLATATITYVAAPTTGDTHVCSYRY